MTQNKRQKLSLSDPLVLTALTLLGTLVATGITYVIACLVSIVTGDCCCG